MKQNIFGLKKYGAWRTVMDAILIRKKARPYKVSFRTVTTPTGTQKTFAFWGKKDKYGKSAHSQFNKYRHLLTKRNPAIGKPVKIYDRIVEIRAYKGTGSNFPKTLFRHTFKDRASIYGLPDGSLLIKGGKPLWKKFTYRQSR